MASAIEQLFVLQEVDTRLRAIKLELEALESAAAAARAEAEEKRAELESRRREMAEMEKQRRDIESQLSDEGQRTKDRRMRMQRIKNEKELSALRREIDLGKDANALLEDQLMRLMENGDAKMGELRTVEEDLAARSALRDQRERELAERTRALQEELDRATADRAAAATELDESLRRRYDLIFERKGGLAVVEVKEGGCSGCRMRLPPQVVTEIHRNTEVVFCPNCQRILYQLRRPAAAAQSGK